MIDFLLNGQPRHCEASPDTSVLELLRETLGQTGTKEGCASGDCGACTVAIGEAGPDGRVHYHSANACITPAHQLQGLSLVTVEGLARGEALHPAQAAMVACHASQCGFCTPGIVMSLFTLNGAQQQRPAPLTPERLEAALGGNLCRCTGYRPIRDAALSMGEHPYARPEWLDLAVDATAPIQEPAAESAFVQPTTLDALVEERRRRHRPLAGGDPAPAPLRTPGGRDPGGRAHHHRGGHPGRRPRRLVDRRCGHLFAPRTAARRALSGLRPPAAPPGLRSGAQSRHPGR